MKPFQIAAMILIPAAILACNILVPTPIPIPVTQTIPETMTPYVGNLTLPYVEIVTETRTPIIEWLTISPTVVETITKTPILIGWTPQTPFTYVTPGTPQVDLTALVSSVNGSVLIEDGRCCAGGAAGSEIQIRVAFQAASGAGQVNEMRVISAGGGCRSEAEMAAANWEPFAPVKNYPFSPPINWVGFYVSVQYRDSSGNISPVYCDDISVEGSPSMPTP